MAGLLMCAIFSFSLNLIYAETNIEEKLVELELTSINDFCVKGELPRDLYSRFSVA